MAFFGKFTIAAVGATVAASTAMAQTDWKDRVSIGGDARIRMQRDIDQVGGATIDQWQPRIRGRLSVSGKVNDQMTLNFRLATGAAAGLDSNKTANQTFTTFGNIKAFDLNLAYLDYKPMNGLTVQLGKNPQHFWSAGGSMMVWNGEMTLEGANVKWMGDMGAMKPYVALTYANMLDRGNTNLPDIAMFGGQAGLKWSADPMDVTFAVGSYNYNNIKGLAAASASALGDSFRGNTPDAAAPTTFAYDYKLLNAGLEIGYNLGFAPVKVYVDYVQNQDPGDFNKGMLAGVRLGALKDVGTWTVMYNYRDVARDAVFSATSDTGFLGGASDVRGHEMQVGYQIWQSAALGLTYSAGQEAASTAAPRNSEAYYLDLVATF